MPKHDDPIDDFDEDEGEMPWVWHARKAVERAVEDVEFDETRGVVYVMSGVDHRLNPHTEGFSSWEDLRTRLEEIAENEWVSYAPFEGGEPVFPPRVDGIVEGALDWSEIESFFERVSGPTDGEELISARELLVPGAGLTIQADVADINSELIRYLAKHPELLREMNPRKFEQIVAELFRDKGYDVEVTKRTRDGGLDIRAYHHSDLGVLLGLIECKRYAPAKKVSVDVIRGLYGVVESERASFGLVATTSTFTQDAKSFQAQNKYRLQLADFEDIKRWLRDYNAR